MLPPFDKDGYLPAGIHSATWQEFTTRFGTTPRRKMLLGGLLGALFIFKQVGCKTLYIDGSFVSSKQMPGDFDACWDPEGVDIDQLHSIEPVFFMFDRGRAAQKAKFSGEFFPATMGERGSGKTFLDFFQTNKETGASKGIVALQIESGSLLL